MHENSPLLSITIPTRNQGSFILECLNSIKNQTFTDFEVHIQDGLSDDNTQEICEAFCLKDSRFFYRRQADEGQSDAINLGLSHSRGKFWTWICSDDFYYSEECLEELINEFEKQLKLDAKLVGVYGQAVMVSEASELVGPFSEEFRVTLGASDFQHNWPFAQPSSIYLLSRVLEVGGVDKTLNLGMDLDLFLKMLEGGRVFMGVSVVVAAVRLQPNSKSVKLRKQTAWNALQIIQRHFSSIGEVRSSHYVREYIDIYIGRILYGDGKMKRAKNEWETFKWKFFRVFPYRIGRIFFLAYFWLRFDSSFKRTPH